MSWREINVASNAVKIRTCNETIFLKVTIMYVTFFEVGSLVFVIDQYQPSYN